MNPWNDNAPLPWDAPHSQTSNAQTSMPSSSNLEAERAAWFQQGSATASASESSRDFDLNAMSTLLLPPHCRWERTPEPDERVLKIEHHHLKQNWIIINIIFFVLFVLLIIGIANTGAGVLAVPMMFVIFWYAISAIMLFPKLKPTWIVFKKGFIEIGHDKSLPLIRTQIAARNAELNSITDSSSSSRVRSRDRFVRNHYRKVSRYYRVMIEDHQVGLKENIAHNLPGDECDEFMDFIHKLIQIVQD